MTRVSFHRLAARELNDAALYYEGETAGLGIKFLDEVERCIGGIVSNPSAGKRVRGQIRRRVLRKFPDGILYSVKDDGIRILAIMNLRRRPAYWGWGGPETGCAPKRCAVKPRDKIGSNP